jgi:antitoxin component YwqK of YwqJK toxin-antitoxin module
MKTFLILITSLSFTITALGQQEWADSSFTNKKEAKNKTIKGLKEGKWIEYFTVTNGVAVQTDEKHASAYTLTIYKANKPYRSTQYFMDGKIMTEMIHHGQDSAFLRFYDENGKVVAEKPIPKNN